MKLNTKHNKDVSIKYNIICYIILAFLIVYTLWLFKEVLSYMSITYLIGY